VLPAPLTGPGSTRDHVISIARKSGILQASLPTVALTDFQYEKPAVLPSQGRRVFHVLDPPDTLTPRAGGLRVADGPGLKLRFPGPHSILAMH
jgi:hypothetical protein